MEIAYKPFRFGLRFARKVGQPVHAYSGDPGRGRPLPLARDPGVSLGFPCFSVFFIGFPYILLFLRDFRACVSLVFGGVSGGFHSLCFSGLFLLTVA